MRNYEQFLNILEAQIIKLTVLNIFSELPPFQYQQIGP